MAENQEKPEKPTPQANSSRKNTAPAKKPETPPVFKRFGTINTTKIGSLNINPEMIVHFLGVKPGDLITYFVGEDQKSLVLKKFDLNEPTLDPNTKAAHKKYLDGEDTYPLPEWKAKKKKFGIK